MLETKAPPKQKKLLHDLLTASGAWVDASDSANDGSMTERMEATIANSRSMESIMLSPSWRALLMKSKMNVRARPSNFRALEPPQLKRWEHGLTCTSSNRSLGLSWTILASLSYCGKGHQPKVAVRCNETMQGPGHQHS